VHVIWRGKNAPPHLVACYTAAPVGRPGARPMNVTRCTTEYRKMNGVYLGKKVLPHRWAGRSPMPSSMRCESVDWGGQEPTPVFLPVLPGTTRQTSCNAHRVGGRGGAERERGGASGRRVRSNDFQPVPPAPAGWLPATGGLSGGWHGWIGWLGWREMPRPPRERAGPHGAGEGGHRYPLQHNCTSGTSP